MTAIMDLARCHLTIVARVSSNFVRAIDAVGIGARLPAGRAASQPHASL